jgi:hypothetical protein
MSSPVFARWSILIGISATALGIILYSQLDRIVKLRVGFTIINGAAVLSISMTLLGLLAALIGGVTWAWRAPLVRLLLSGVSMGVVAFLLDELVDINIHGPTALFMFVVVAGVFGCALILLIAATRFVLSRWRRQY